MDNSSGVGVLDKAALVLGALEAGPATPRRRWCRRPAWPGRPPTGWPSRSSTTAWSRRDLQGRFVLGPRLAELAAAAGEDRLLAAAGPVLAQLRDTTGESAQLYRRQGDEPGLRRRRRAAQRPARHRAGRRALPMTAGSAAQVLLAWEEPDRLHRGLRGRALHRDRAGRRTPPRLGAERRRARAGRRVGVGAGARPRRPRGRRGVGVRPDRAADPAARPPARADRCAPPPRSCRRCSRSRQGERAASASARPPSTT